MTLLTDEELLECIHTGNVVKEGYVQYADARPFEVLIRIRGPEAHRIAAHAHARVQQDKDIKAREAQAIIDKANAPFISRYARKRDDTVSLQTG